MGVCVLGLLGWVLGVKRHLPMMPPPIMSPDAPPMPPVPASRAATPIAASAAAAHTRGGCFALSTTDSSAGHVTTVSERRKA